MKKKYLVLFSVFVLVLVAIALVVCVFGIRQALAWEYIKLRPEVNGTVNIRKRADVKSNIIGKTLYRYTRIKIVGEKFPWYKTKDGGWIFYQTVEQFPYCLSMK